MNGKELKELVERLMVEIHPCRTCSFAFATHGRHDAAFGTGAPLLCERCAKDQKDEDWQPVKASAYSPLIQRCLKVLPKRCILCQLMPCMCDEFEAAPEPE
jgi:hypothetical protein